MITEFQGEFRFLSNFVGGVEQRYQAAKCVDKNEAKKLLAMSPGQAKRAGRRVRLHPEWEKMKLQVMEILVRDKFSREPFRSQLLATGDQELIEGNWWNDTFWGVCHGVGENHLGKILMKVRREARDGGETNGTEQ